MVVFLRKSSGLLCQTHLSCSCRPNCVCVCARDTGTSGSASNAPSGNRPTPFGQAQQSAATTVPSRPAQGGSGEHRRSGHHRASTAPSEQTSTSLQSLRGSSFQATAGSGKTVSHYITLDISCAHERVRWPLVTCGTLHSRVRSLSPERHKKV